MIEAFAARQHDHIAMWQLLDRRVPRKAIEARVARRRLRAVRRGVYKVGPTRTTRRGIWAADALRCGPDAGLDGVSGLQLLGVIREYQRRTTVVTVHRGRRCPQGIDLRTTTEPTRFLRWDGIPTVDVPRALVTAAPDLDDEQLEAAYEKALTHFDLIPSLFPKRNARLNALIKDHQTATALTDSELENLFRRIVRQAGLPQPNAKLRVGRRIPDFIWPDRGVVVEVNGPHHGEQMEADARRSVEIWERGLIVVTFTKLQLIRHPGDVPRALTPFLSSVG